MMSTPAPANDTVEAQNSDTEGPAVRSFCWGYGEFVELHHTVNFGKGAVEEPAVTFIAECGHTGGHVSLLDLLKYAMVKHSALVEKARQEVSAGAKR